MGRLLFAMKAKIENLPVAKVANSANSLRSASENSPLSQNSQPDEAAITERAGLCADSVSASYLDAWARLNSQKPMRVSETEWRLAVDGGGRFLDAWGWVFESEWAWTPGELLDVPGPGRMGGLIWRLKGRAVVSYGPDHVRLDDGTIIERSQ